MTRALLRIAWILPPLLAALIGLAIGLGTFRPSHPALVGFVEGCEGQPQPCWYGIVPGETTRQEANRLLTALHYVQKVFTEDSAGYAPSRPEDQCMVLLVMQKYQMTIDGLFLFECPGLQWGDLIGERLVPENVIDGCYGISTAGDHVYAFGRGWLSINATVNTVGLYQSQPPSLDSYGSENVYRWHGFASSAGYERLEPHSALTC